MDATDLSNLATKTDLTLLEQRLTIRITAIVAGIATLAVTMAKLL